MRNFLPLIFFTYLVCVFSVMSHANQINRTDDSFLHHLPVGFLPFEDFEKEFKLGETSTEQLHPLTQALSQTMHKNTVDGLELLLKADEQILEHFKLFIPSIKFLAPLLAKRLCEEGRIFLVGSGASGRVGIGIAAKCSHFFPKYQKQIQGVIAGGDSVLIRAKEGFEDSEVDGEQALKSYDLGPKDTVILISASGSAFFNVGCGHFSANKGAKVFYFYNSTYIPPRTQQLFDREENAVIPLCVDSGPQAIAGSTRLQAAASTEECLTALMGTALYLSEGKKLLAENYPQELALNMQKGFSLMRSYLEPIGKWVEKEKEIFSNPHANFRQLKDKTTQGYVTSIASEDSLLEVFIDSTETSPTFSLNPIRKEKEADKKRAEFRAYLIGEKDNLRAWETILNRKINQENREEMNAFLVAGEADGINAYSKRPKGKGNFLIGVAKLKEGAPLPSALISLLKNAQQEETCTGVLFICHGLLTNEQTQELSSIHHKLIMQNVPHDPLGLTETLILKQTLNLISNGAMVLMNKVHGNQMIDVRAANRKLIDRCIRLIKSIWNEYQTDDVLQDKDLYHYIAHVNTMKASYQEQGIYTPSVVKIVLAMLYLKKTPSNFQEVVDFLNERQERIDWLGE